jgi:hypothetical protein
VTWPFPLGEIQSVRERRQDFREANPICLDQATPGAEVRKLERYWLHRNALAIGVWGTGLRLALHLDLQSSAATDAIRRTRRVCSVLRRAVFRMRHEDMGLSMT